MVREEIKNTLRKAIKDAGYKVPDNFVVENPKMPSWGDYSTNCAFMIIGSERNKFDPCKVAEDISEKFHLPIVKEVKVVQGYLNFWLTNDYLVENTQKILLEAHKYGQSQIGKGQKVLIEYSQPNVNKTMHIGHARNDYLGMALARLLENCGCQVIKANYYNDRGIAIAKAMLMYDKNHQGETPELKRIRSDYFVNQIYAEFEQEKESNPELEKQAKEYLKKWEAGDSKILKLWKKITNWAYQGFEKTYQREGTEFDTAFYESKIYQRGKEVVKKYLKKNVFKKAQDGHIYVDLTKYGLDKKVLIRADGTAIYITSDLVLAEEKNTLGIDKSIYVVDIYQSYHFKVLFKIFELLGYRWAKKCYHLGYGYVFLKGEKMSSRKGNIIPTDELIDQLKSKIITIMDTASKHKIDSHREKEQIAEKLALGAIKYGMLKYEEQKDIHFDPSQTICLEGETGPYLQYTFARIQGIMAINQQLSIRKAQDTKIKNQKLGQIQIDRLERDLMRELVFYPEVILKSAEEYKPHYLCNYLYNLAKYYNTFYNAMPVLKAKTTDLKNFRLMLCQATAQVLKNGLGILGISAPDKM